MRIAASSVRAIHRGLTEVQKALKRIDPIHHGHKLKKRPEGLIILAGDINPSKVIEHFPILCEDRGLPYIFIESRRALGEAATTKRSTCVVFLMRDSKPLPQPRPADGHGDDKNPGDGVTQGYGNPKYQDKSSWGKPDAFEDRKHRGKKHKPKPENADRPVMPPRPPPAPIDPKELAEYQVLWDKEVKFVRRAWREQVYPYIKGTEDSQMAGCTIATA